jgi:hypothetical protein
MTDPLAPSDSFRLAGAVLDGRFRVVREVAEGGFAVVYYATQLALDRPVALKVLKTPAGMGESAEGHFHDRFATEAKTIARIRHPNIVDVYDFGISKMPSGQTAPWMALEWIDGTTLDEHLTGRRGQGGQSPAEVLAILRPVFRAFAYTHRDGIAHRDIKPANIMVVSSGSGGNATESGALLRILDFGIAKVMNSADSPGSGQTRTAGMPAFSPQYAAPEQMAYGRTGPWTDVHALGLIVAEMLVDQPPYQQRDMQLFEEVMSPKRPTPSKRGKNVGPWEVVLSKALALSPGERWKSAGELLSALEETVEKATSVASTRVRGPARPALPQNLRLPSEAGLARGTAPAPVGIARAAQVLVEGISGRRGPIMAFGALIGITLAVWITVWLVSSRRDSPEVMASPATIRPSSRAQAAVLQKKGSTRTTEVERMVVVPFRRELIVVPAEPGGTSAEKASRSSPGAKP